MFSEASVCPQEGGVLHPKGEGSASRGGSASGGGGEWAGVCLTTPSTSASYCSGRYASYWKAYLLSSPTVVAER